ncbi:hypothetical protein A5747_13490 [Mycobacterium sp. IS-836]|nr:hypothetical protein A5747_13490 [Mycobacterium sp. IS-836]
MLDAMPCGDLRDYINLEHHGYASIIKARGTSFVINNVELEQEYRPLNGKYDHLRWENRFPRWELRITMTEAPTMANLYGQPKPGKPKRSWARDMGLRKPGNR